MVEAFGGRSDKRMISVIIVFLSILVEAYIVGMAYYFFNLGIIGRSIVAVLSLLISIIAIKKISKFFNNRKQLIIILFISTVLLIMGENTFIPFYKPNNTNEKVVITATGDKNENSNANEVWINSIRINDVSYNLQELYMQSDAWDIRDGLLFYNGKQEEASITLVISDDEDVQIEFLTHDWSGIVNVTFENNTERLDLYSQSSGVYLCDINNQDVNYENNIFCVLGCLVLIFVILEYIYDIIMHWICLL